MDFDHFNSAAKGIVTLDELSTLRHPVIGFIGALYNWIDVDLICRIAEVHPEYSVLLVGPVAAESNQLEKYSNIVTVGAKPYGILPSYLSNIDVCIIPFKLNDITLASNPIKMYEYLAAGKPVVSTALPEVLKVASDLVYVSKDEVDFIKKIEMAILELEHNNDTSVTARMNFARKNSWESRVEVMEKFLHELVTNQ
jgi:glycosyltransferase involved in cell wall biosynthesis